MTWLAANAYLYGWVDTDLPGHRQIKPLASTRTVAAAYQRFDTYVTAIGTAMSADSWSIEIQNTGRVRLSAASAATVEFPDSLGWLLGVAEAPNVATQSVSEVLAYRPSPACIPLLGAVWSQVESVVEDSLTRDRTQRGHGHVWGGARIWHWTLTMTRMAYQSLIDGGWCLRGKVSIEGDVSSAMGSGQPDGALTGYALGLSAPRWLGPHLEFCEVTLRVAGANS